MSSTEPLNRLDDPERLQALADSGLLNKNVQARMEHLAFASCRLLLADVSQLNAMDEHFRYVVAGYPPGDWPILLSGQSGCREVIEQGVALSIEDSRQHPVTCSMPWVERFRGYLGVPVSYHGQILGSLCVLSVEPRAWKDYEVAALSGVARLAGMSLEWISPPPER